VVGAGFEWARLCKLSDAAAWIYGIAAAALFVLLYVMGQDTLRLSSRPRRSSGWRSRRSGSRVG